MDKQYWKRIWEKKGRVKGGDIKEMGGYKSWSGGYINTKEISEKIRRALRIKRGDRVLEVGCGAGALAQYLECDYVGVDYAKNLVKKHIKILNNSVVVAEAADIPFKDKYFDKVFAYSVFHYFPNKKYVKQAVKELKRVCKGEIFIGDLPIASHRKAHMLFKKSEFKGGEFSEGFYNKKRFNVLLENGRKR